VNFSLKFIFCTLWGGGETNCCVYMARGWGEGWRQRRGCLLISTGEIERTFLHNRPHPAPRIQEEDTFFFSCWRFESSVGRDACSRRRHDLSVSLLLTKRCERTRPVAERYRRISVAPPVNEFCMFGGVSQFSGDDRGRREGSGGLVHGALRSRVISDTNARGDLREPLSMTSASRSSYSGCHI
jgi:hypothetical protein